MSEVLGGAGSAAAADMTGRLLERELSAAVSPHGLGVAGVR
ncbi:MULTISPECIES: hypothetical protein [unclassified Nonomuraea]|nr:hypothetical protein [Nonomuraea sp. 3-1Str]